jgi:hypothetical protein
MPRIAQGQTSDCANPVLDLFTVVNGLVTDVEVLEFQIWDVTGTPVQVFPVSGRQAVDLADCPVGDRLGLGHYVAEWPVPAVEPVGAHEVRWFFRLTVGGAELTSTEPFDVVESVSAGPFLGYCTVQDLRDEGVPTTGVGAKTDAELARIIERSTQLIDVFTGRFFRPVPMQIRVDGTGGRELLLGHPIVSISEVRLVSSSFIDSEAQVVELDDLEIYNRHLGGLLNPDDRENPRLSWVEFDERLERLPFAAFDVHGVFEPSRWPRGRQNVQITGIFGYTDPDGTPTGRTPDLISRACALLAIRDAEVLTSEDRFDARNAWRLSKLKTRDQEIQWGVPGSLGGRGAGACTGDPEIDTILARYSRPPNFGAA